jgi:hypothetical protein
MSPAEHPAVVAQAYQLLLACRMHYETAEETQDYVAILRTLFPWAAPPADDLPPLPPIEQPSRECEAESLYRRVLAVWSHPGAADAVRAEAHRFLLAHLVSGHASAAFVASVCDEGRLILGHPEVPPEDPGPAP